MAQAIGEHNYATWSEYSFLLKLQRTRHEISALDLAAADMKAIRCSTLYFLCARSVVDTDFSKKEYKLQKEALPTLQRSNASNPSLLERQLDFFVLTE